MKKLLLLSLLLSWAGGPARAATGGEVAAVAGAAAAASLVGPIVATATTKSEVNVTVEMYRETYPHRPAGMSWAEWRNLPLESQRTLPFKLTRPTALKRMRDHADASNDLTPTKALELADRLAGAQAEFRTIAQQLDHAILLIRSWKRTDSLFAKILNEFTRRADAARRADRAIADFRNATLKTPIDVLVSSNLLAQVRAELRKVPSDFIPESADLFQTWLTAEFINPNTVLNVSTNGTNITNGMERVDAAKTTLAPRLAPPADTGPDRKIALVIVAALNLVRELEGNTNQIVDEKRVIEMNTHNVRQKLDGMLKAFGFRFQTADLQGVTSPEAVLERLWQGYLPALVAKLADQTLTLTLTGVTVGANFGPLVNEAFQTIYSGSRMLDTIFGDAPGQTNRWVVLNTARSSGAAGDHNAIIYFDNILNPILKSASFDPSQFIAAHGKLYRRAISVMTDIYGVPLPSAAGGANPASPSGGLNLYDPQARVLNAQNQNEAQKAALRDTLAELIATWKAAQPSFGSINGWKDAAAGTNGVATVRSKLAELAVKLESANHQ